MTRLIERLFGKRCEHEWAFLWEPKGLKNHWNVRCKKCGELRNHRV